MVKNKQTADPIDNSVDEQVVFTPEDLKHKVVVGAVLNESQKRVTKQKKDQDKKSNQHKSNEQAEKIYAMARKSSQVLFRTSTVFPFDFFPDTLTINANKLDIVSSAFFGSHQTTSIPLRDIANVEIQTSPFFATLRIINIRYPLQPSVLQYLKKADAVKAKQIIDGLLVAISHGADITQIEPKKFIHEIEQVGESAVN